MLAPSAAGSTYQGYASPAAFERRLASGPFSTACTFHVGVCGNRQTKGAVEKSTAPFDSLGADYHLKGFLEGGTP